MVLISDIFWCFLAAVGSDPIMQESPQERTITIGINTFTKPEKQNRFYPKKIFWV